MICKVPVTSFRGRLQPQGTNRVGALRLRRCCKPVTLRWSRNVTCFGRMLVFALLLASQNASRAIADGDDYPSRPIRIVVPNPAGGSSDTAARMLADHLTSAWRQPVVVDNRPGGNTAIGTAIVAHAAPDGYTILFGVPSLSTFKVLMKEPGFDVANDLSPISEVMVSPFVIAVSRDLPVSDIGDLIRLAKANPGKLNYGGLAGAQTLATELFKMVAGVDIVQVPYQGEAPAASALAQGSVQVLVASAINIRPLADAGLVKPIAVTSAQRLPSMPNVPTVAEGGLSGYDVGFWFGLLAPSNTLSEIQSKLSEQVRLFTQRQDVKDRFAPLRFVMRSSTPEEFRHLITSEIGQWQDAARFAGISPQ